MSAVVTTTTPHGFSSDEHVVLVVPREYGMHLDYVDVVITVTGAATFLTNLDTFGMDPFVVPALTSFTPAQALPASELCDNIATF
jgi:hypothetical protein